MNLKNFILFAFLCLSAVAMQAKVKMPHIFSNNMIIQRDRPINVWGWANAGERVEVSFEGQKVKATGDKNGTWKVVLKAIAYGGPYEMTIKGKGNVISYTNILVGDVWLCSGQSNMEWVVKNSNQAAREIADANYPQIRHFSVQKDMNTTPTADVEGTWEVCSPATVGDFTAVGYFFGRELYQNTHIPIGLINSSWGGTDIEPWTSAEMMNTVPEFGDKMKELKTVNVEENKAKLQQFRDAMRNDIGIAENWQNKPALFTARMQVPQEWGTSELRDMDGCVWFRHEFTLPAGCEGKEAILSLGYIDDDDLTFINGTQVGSTIGSNTLRRYVVAAGILKEGKNTLVIDVKDTGGGGGLTSKEEVLYVEVGGAKYPLAGVWNYVTSVDSRTFGYKDLGPNSFPTSLYNAMIAPIVQYGIKGAIWYQGENNASRARQYRTLFPNMINDWRTKWGYEFPFYWVQLANFMSPDQTPPQKCDWAELREAQTMTQRLAQTGEAVIIDIGEANDIHPRNKQDVGKRLAYHALNKDYGMKNVVFAGPSFKSMKVEANTVVVEFENVGQGLITRNKYGYVNAFAIAGADKKFYWARAYIDGNNKVVVSCNKVVNPVAIRYGWANNPDDADLYNVEGLPACPFRADAIN